MPRKDAFWAGGEPALAREPNPGYTEGMIRVTGTIAIGEEEIHQEFIRASGPGGQNVNKVATAVQLRFDVAHSPSLPEDVRERLTRLAGKRYDQGRLSDHRCPAVPHPGTKPPGLCCPPGGSDPPGSPKAQNPQKDEAHAGVQGTAAGEQTSPRQDQTPAPRATGIKPIRFLLLRILGVKQ